MKTVKRRIKKRIESTNKVEITGDFISVSLESTDDMDYLVEKAEALHRKVKPKIVFASDNLFE